jgi:ribosomal protein L11 methyltransferase
LTWLQVAVSVPGSALAEVEGLLEAHGALALTLLNDADEVVLEPAPGETPLWSTLRVRALLPLDANVAELGKALRGLMGTTEIEIDFVADRDWQANAAAHAVNEVFADRIWLLPKGAAVHGEDDGGASRGGAGLTRLYLEPGLAFGSGAHPTTRLCLSWLAEHLRGTERVLDFGCGSGVLAIAAGLLGARVVAVDHDPQAVVASRENATYNGLGPDRIDVMDLSGWRRRSRGSSFDVVVANILAGPLMALADEFESVLAPGGSLVLSGLLEDQGERVMNCYPTVKFVPPLREAGWLCLQGTRTA